MILILLLLLINIVYGQYINVYDNSIITFNYTNNYTIPLSIYINNYKFRESSLQPNYDGLFSIAIKPGNYYIDNYYFKNFDYKMETGIKIPEKNKISKDILLKKDYTLLNKIEYFDDKDHQIKISLMLKLERVNKSFIGEYKILLLINNKKIIKSNNKIKVFKYLSNYINMKKGFNIIEFYGNSIKNYWCSCNSISDGFQYGRHFLVWKRKKYEENISLEYITENENTVNVISVKLNNKNNNIIYYSDVKVNTY